MSTARYPAITAEILRRIRSGVYVDRIPSTRALAKEFKSAKQTITNALRPLLESGVIKAKVPEGLVPVVTVKAAERPRIGVVCQAREENMLRSTLFKVIRKLLDEGGYELELMCFPDGLPALNPERVFKGEFAGVIFRDSLISLELAEYFAQRNVPVVSCNLMPLIPALNYVEIDVFAVYRELADHLIKCNYRKVSWFFASQLESYGVFARRSWRRIQQEKALTRFPGDVKVVHQRPSKAGYAFTEFLLKLHRSRNKPEVVICSLGQPEKYLEKLEEEIPDFLPGVVFITFQDEKSEKLRHTSCRMARFENSGMQFAEALKALEEKMLVGNRQPIRRMLKFKFEMLDNIPIKK